MSWIVEAHSNCHITCMTALTHQTLWTIHLEVSADRLGFFDYGGTAKQFLLLSLRRKSSVENNKTTWSMLGSTNWQRNAARLHIRILEANIRVHKKLIHLVVISKRRRGIIDTQLPAEILMFSFNSRLLYNLFINSFLIPKHSDVK